jgi:rubrerythrin
MTVNIASGKELLKRAIKGELDGLRFYNFLADKATNGDAKRKLSGLADDEKRHEAILKNLYKRLYKEDVGELPAVGINALAKFFDGSKAKGKQTERDYINLAIEVELAATNFYKEGAAATKDGEMKKLYESLAAEEFTHFEILQAEKDSIGGNYYWFGTDLSSPMED